jgi:hypothetical protein
MVDFAANAPVGYHVNITTSPRDLVKKDRFRTNIRKFAQQIVGVLPIMYPVSSSGLLVLEFDSGEEEKITEALTKAIQQTKFRGFWFF